jgi:hypothetical protein
MSQTFIKPQIKNKWTYCLRKLFSYPSLVVIGGAWKTGKTDFSLKISEDLTKIGLIHETASNIETFGHYPLISDLVSLKQWLYSNNKLKLYIFDEASEHLDSRRAMSSKNVGFINIIPQISKAHAKMIVVGHQLLRVDKTLLDDTYCRGVFLKTELKSAKLISHLLNHPYTFRNLSPTTVKFDPYAIAPFTEKPINAIYFKQEDKQLLWKWANGSNYKELGLKPMQLHRRLQKFIRETLENELNNPHT